MSVAALIDHQLAERESVGGDGEAEAVLLPGGCGEARRDEVGAGSHPARTFSDMEQPTLEATLIALLQGETDACLVCGEPVEGEEERVECPACGSVLEPAPREVISGQMTLIDG